MDLGLQDLWIIIPVLLIAMTLHEAIHAFTGYWLGDDTAKLEGRISLNPLRHIDPFTTLILPIITFLLFGVPLLAAKPVPFNPNRVRYDEYGAALVGIAGPLTNLMLALVGGGIAHIFQAVPGTEIYRILYIFTEINIALFVFNMIPIPPLDGSRLVYAFAPESVQEVFAKLEYYGIFIIFTLIILVPSFTNLLVNLNQSLLRTIL